jgi:hypothetical protein
MECIEESNGEKQEEELVLKRKFNYNEADT